MPANGRWDLIRCLKVKFTWCSRIVKRVAHAVQERKTLLSPPLHGSLTPVVGSVYKFELATVATRLLRASELKLCL